MQNIEKLFENNNELVNNICLKNNELNIMINSQDGIFSGIQIARLIKNVNSAHKKYGKLKYRINIFLGNITFIDKLSYVFLEIICEYLIEVFRHPVQIYMSVQKTIGTEGIFSSPLLLLNNTKITNIKKYPEKFKFDLYKNHYRRIINGVGKEDTNYLGEIYIGIDSFLKYFSIEENCRDIVAHVIAELVGNAGEHGKSECLIDIDVAPGYAKYEDEIRVNDDEYYGINIAVINFSDKLLGEDILNNIILYNGELINSRYNTIKKAYSNHLKCFDDDYCVEDFSNISAFQTKISGRTDYDATGGTGLTVLIKSLEEKSENHRCYVVSGKRSINFLKGAINYDAEGWIGFNESGNFVEMPPDPEIISECFINMPGTAYNFNFVMKGKLVNE